MRVVEKQTKPGSEIREEVIGFKEDQKHWTDDTLTSVKSVHYVKRSWGNLKGEVKLGIRKFQAAEEKTRKK